jgi:hypothetical protein
MFVTRGVTATGYFSSEVYATTPDDNWMSPAYSDGTDAYKDGVVRFDIFWYRENAGEPNSDTGFFRQYWDRSAATASRSASTGANISPPTTSRTGPPISARACPGRRFHGAAPDSRPARHLLHRHYRERLIGHA